MRNPLRGWRRWLLVLVLAGVLAAAWGAWHLQEFATRPLGPATEPLLEVPEGASFRTVVQRMKDKGWVDRPLEMRLLGRLFHVAPRIHAGEYRLTPDMTPLDVLEALTSGDVVLHSVSFPEGKTVRQFLERLRAKEALDFPTLPEGPGDPALLDMLNLDERGYESAEGWLFPETYRFTRGTSATQILRRSHERMLRVLEEEWANREEDLPYDEPYEALVLASIVEKETAVPEERREIAGVFINRLRKGMRLQTDPTVIYGLGKEFDGDLRTRHLRDRTPYNTYRIDGLPPTPIANPGRAAIRAVCQPEDTDALYFVSRGDGTHVFSETLQEHNRAVRRYQLGGR
ncbi:MAG: endolytic transglycosylase MltG [Thiohalorhabdus sp.]|uniref:endolytic transglycosylase MltG n=1 Tax=Thiohalorhabdus sp. TaxID=3094134 RepID=UPI00397EB3BC